MSAVPLSDDHIHLSSMLPSGSKSILNHIEPVEPYTNGTIGLLSIVVTVLHNLLGTYKRTDDMNDITHC